MFFVTDPGLKPWANISGSFGAEATTWPNMSAQGFNPGYNMTRLFALKGRQRRVAQQPREVIHRSR